MGWSYNSGEVKIVELFANLIRGKLSICLFISLGFSPAYSQGMSTNNSDLKMEINDSHHGYKYSPSGNVMFIGKDNIDLSYIAPNGSIFDCGEEGQCGPILPFPPMPPVPGVNSPMTVPNEVQSLIENFEGLVQQDFGGSSQQVSTDQCGPTIPFEDE